MIFYPKIADGSEYSSICLIADDTIICKSKKHCGSFDSLLNKMNRWFKTKGLTNPTKNQIMKFGSNFSADYFSFGTSIQITNVCKYLGSFVDKYLTFKFHIEFCGIV